MSSLTANAIDELFREGRLERAARMALALDADGGGAPPVLRRLSAAVFASLGRDRELAGVSGLGVAACKSAEDAQSWCASLEDGPTSLDYLTAGVALTWFGASEAAYGFLRSAHDRALEERRFHVATAAAERLARHAVLFGDTARARTSLLEAAALADEYDLAHWRTRCLASLAALSIDTDDLPCAQSALESVAGNPAEPEAKALFAPSAVRLAALGGNESPRERWYDPSLFALALDTNEPAVAIAATSASLLAARDAAAAPILDQALTRALAMVDSPTNHVEFLTLAARCGSAENAALATASLRATFAPQRRYLDAHQRLARAYQLLRADERTGAIDAAGDAARAFDGMGMRYWANEAMLLLVRHDEVVPRPLRRRPTAISLTRREQQVAHLIRRGASNREVAHTLQISEHTVERHVSSILSRLGLRSRWQIVDARISGTEH